MPGIFRIFQLLQPAAFHISNMYVRIQFQLRPMFHSAFHQDFGCICILHSCKPGMHRIFPNVLPLRFRIAGILCLPEFRLL